LLEINFGNRFYLARIRVYDYIEEFDVEFFGAA
jgi:hypothetical protein